MSNLPPGVNINDIPGNRPEDIEYEAKWNHLFGLWKKANVLLDDDITDNDLFIQAVDIAMDFAYERGWKDGRDDTLMVIKEEEEYGND